MDLSKLNYIHLRNGRFQSAGDHPTETQTGDLDALFDRLQTTPPRSGLVLHFHGGLVDFDSGKSIAARLAERLGPAGAHTVGFVWESGFFETVKHNLGEIAQEAFFRRLVGKVVIWALQRLGPHVQGLRGPGGFARVDGLAVGAQVDAWLSGTAGADDSPPFEIELEPQAQAEEEPEPQLPDPSIRFDVSRDWMLSGELQRIANGRIDPREEGTARGGNTLDSTTTLMSPEALDQLLGPAEPGQRGVFSTLQLALVATKVVYRVVRRTRGGRGHGLFTTAVEEIFRELYLASLGKAFFWGRMKQDTLDAFGEDPECGGTAFLERLDARLRSGMPIPRIVLTGHSTGAIYICHFLAAADRILPPEVKFDIVFLAPAVTCELFGETLEAYRHRIRGFRSFAMSDPTESHDRLVPIVYVRSLLYFVSGVVESEEDADVPLVGMQRFLSGAKPYLGPGLPGVDTVHDFFQTHPNAAVWSPADLGDGMRSQAKRHGDFDDEEQTVGSLAWIVEHGF